MKTAKIYCSKKELTTIAPNAKLIEAYDAFQLVEMTPADFKKTAAKVPVEDVTAQFKLSMAGKSVDTKKARYNAKGTVLPHSAYKTTPKLTAGKHHYLVQFIGPVKDAWLRESKKAGGDFRGHYADFTSIFRLTDAALKKVQALPFVHWVGHLTHESRIAKEVLKTARPLKRPLALAAGTPLARPGHKKHSSRVQDTLVIQFFDSKDMKAALPGIKRAGATLLGTEKSGIAVVQVPTAVASRKKTVQSLSALHGVRLITTFVVPASCNDAAADIMGTTKAFAAPTPAKPDLLGLTGAGEIIAVADTGLDTGDPATVITDFAGRIQAIHSWPISPSFNPLITNPGADDGAADLDSGHGTHVTGSVLGSGSPSGPAIRGLSRGARLVFQAVEQRLALTPQGRITLGTDPFQLAGLPNDITRLFDQAYQDGARIHSNSWGSDDAGDYSSTSRQLDQFVWKNPDLCILVAAGNSGVDLNPADGVVDEGSVGSPGTAKNCITVGASQSIRDFPDSTWGDFWPDSFPAETLHSEKIAADSDKMAAFSGRGPTIDGRIKPDIVAPGTYILSTRSTKITGDGWAAFSNGHYMYDGGTSMATPLVAGAVGLVREYLRTHRNIASPSAALLKAALICGAQRMPLPYVPPNVLFDNHQGFGRVNIDNIVAPPVGNFDFEDVTTGLRTGQAHEVSITADNNRRLRIVLAYSDYPGRGLKNNLNLMLTAPDGSRHVGNATSGQLALDTRNNVEAIEIANPATGTWRVQIIASNVPQGPQPFALAWFS
jgi:serine protease AprX